jgi:hypothetical protein
MFVATRAVEVTTEQAAVRSLTARLAPSEVPLPDVPVMWRAFDVIERLAAGAKLLLAARVDESGVWQKAGDRDAANWMARHAGGSVTGARTDLNTSRRLASQPVTSAALQRGELSVRQAEYIAGAVANHPEAESRLVGMAGQASLAELREECGRVKAKADPDPEATHRRIRADRRLRQGTGSDGAWWLAGRGPVEDGGELNAVLGPIIDQMFQEAQAEGRYESREAYAWDALVELVRRAHEWAYEGSDDHDDDVDDEADEADEAGHTDEAGDTNDERPETPAGGDDPVTNSPNAADPPAPAPATVRPARRSGKRRSQNPKFLALLRVDWTALTRGSVEGDELCELSNLGPVPVSVARDLLGDAVLKLVITRGVDVQGVVHLGRGPTVAQKIALRWQTPQCTVLGCSRTDIQHDHRVDWAKTRHTVLSELDELCTHHHELKTRHGWALVPGAGMRPMVPPDHPDHPASGGGQEARRKRHAA